MSDKQPVTSLSQDDLYPLYHGLVAMVSMGFHRKFYKFLAHEELADLTQTCWEYIIKHYPTYDHERGELETWIKERSKNALFKLLRSNNSDKRKVAQNSVSLDRLLVKYKQFI